MYTNSFVYLAASVAGMISDNTFPAIGSGSRVDVRTDDGADVGLIHDNLLQVGTLSVSGASLFVHDNH